MAEDNCLSIFWGEIIRSFWSIGLLLNKWELSNMNIIKLLTILLLTGGSFLSLGVTLNYTLHLILWKWLRVALTIYLIQNRSFKNVKYNFIRQTADKGDLGYVYGEVFRVKNARLEG